MTSTTFFSRACGGTRSSSLYLVHPIYDLIFVCGGQVLILSAISTARFGLNVAAPQQDPMLLGATIFGTYMLSGPHAAGTIFRLYGESQNRNQFKLVAYFLPLVLISMFIAGLYYQALASILGTLYMLLVWHHFMAQSYGIALMYCARAGMILSEKEKVTPKLILHLAVVAAVAQQFSQGNHRNSFLDIPLLCPTILPDWIITVLQFILLAVLSIFTLQQVRRHSLGTPAMPLPAVVTLNMGALFLILGHSLNDLVWLFVPNFFHASQYLTVLLRGQYKKSQQKHSQDALTGTTNYFSRLFIVGLILFTILPIMVSRAGFSFPLCSAMAFFALGLHHFAADACIWKLKNKNNLSRLTV